VRFASAGEHVDTYWSEPPFQGWWVARVQSLNMGTLKAKLYYDRGDEGAEVEEMDLLKEVRAGHVSMHEDGLPCRNTIARPKPKRPRAPRPPRPRKDAKAPADAAGAPAEGHHGAPETEACDEEEEEDEDEDEESASESDEVLDGPRARKPSARARAAAESDDDDLPSAEELLSRKRKAAERAVAAGAARAAAEAKAKAARAAPRERERAAPKPDPRAAAAAAEAEKEREQRQRVASSLAEALATAAADLAAEGAESLPDATPADIAAAVEEAVYRAHGGLSKEYKARIRSLAFNLKDAANPDLRARVLLGEVPPAKLAVMSPDELASRQLSAWREAKAAEAVNAVTMRADADVDKLGRRLRKTHKGEEVVEAADDGIAETPSLPPLPPAAADEVAPPEPFSPAAPGAGGGPFSAAGGADLLAAEASRGDGAPVESFEAFAARAAEDEGARAPSGAKRTRIELPSEDVTVVRAAPQPAPPPPAPVAPRPAPAPAPAPAPRAPRAPKPPAGPEWSGTLQKDSPGLSLPLHARPVGGEQAPLGGGFLPAVLHVKGRTTLEQVEKYVTDIQRGRSGSRGLTLATAAPPAGASDADRAALAALAASYAERGRAGVAQPSSSVEVYLVPDGDLARRILAAEALPPPAEGAMLLVAVHHKGLGPAKPKRLPSPDALHPAASPDKAPPFAAVEAPAAPPAAPDIQNDFLAVTKALLAAAAGNASAMGVLNAALPPQRARMGDEDLPEFDLFGGRAPAMQQQQPQLMAPQGMMQAPMGQMPPQMMMMQQQQMPPGYGAPQGYPGGGMYGAGAPIPGPRPPPGPPPGPRPPPGPPPPSAWPQQQMWQQQQPQFQVPLGVDPRGPPPPMGIRPPMPPPGPPPGMLGMQQGMLAPPQPWEVAQQPMQPWMQQGAPPPQPPPGQPPQQRLDPRMR